MTFTNLNHVLGWQTPWTVGLPLNTAQTAPRRLLSWYMLRQVLLLWLS